MHARFGGRQTSVDNHDGQYFHTNITFQQDGAPCHTTKIKLKVRLVENNIPLLKKKMRFYSGQNWRTTKELGFIAFGIPLLQMIANSKWTICPVESMFSRQYVYPVVILAARLLKKSLFHNLPLCLLIFKQHKRCVAFSENLKKKTYYWPNVPPAKRSC